MSGYFTTQHLKSDTDLVVQAWNPSILESEAGRIANWVQPGLSEILSQNKKWAGDLALWEIWILKIFMEWKLVPESRKGIEQPREKAPTLASRWRKVSQPRQHPWDQIKSYAHASTRMGSDLKVGNGNNKIRFAMERLFQLLCGEWIEGQEAEQVRLGMED